jgi:putative heme-binding domain-containing protein
MIRTSLVSGILLLAALAAGAQGEGLARGRKLFDSHCARCHNMGGTGGEGPSLARPTLRHAADDDALVFVIQEGIEGTDMPGNWMISGADARDIATYVRSLGRVAPEPVPGDPGRGRDLFEGSGGCGSCHLVRGEGGILGPDLTDVGLRRGPGYLRESLVNPGASVPDGYLVVRARNRAGEEIVGMRMNEDTFTIQVRDQRGRVHSLAKLELPDLEKAFGESLMPGYGAVLAAGELDDLVAYLASLRGER